MMKLREYTLHHRHGPEERLQGTVYDMLCDRLFMLSDGYIVPKIVVDSILRSGGIGVNGMVGDCVWQPFSIDQKEYEQLEKRFIEIDYSHIEIPDWVVDENTWQILNLEIKHGMPHEEQLSIDRRTRVAEAALETARQENNEMIEGKSMMELVNLSAEWNDLFNRYNDEQ